MKLGITGTRNGFTKNQLNSFKTVFKDLQKEGVEEFHQGQCIGVDVESAEWINTFTKGAIPIHSHPPLKQELVGECHVDVTYPKKNYFARNRDIVHASDILIACTPTEVEQPTGGTWYTYRYAVDKGHKVILITPLGKTIRLNF